MAPWRAAVWWGAVLVAALLVQGLLGAAPLRAQSQPSPEGILVLNQERFYGASLYGRRVQAELEAASQALSAENREIEAQLTEEELRLTNERASLPVEEFRALADEFDARVVEIREAQDAKGRRLATQAEAARQRFFELAVPVLLELVRDRGAAVIMDSRAVILSADAVDITDEALARIDATVGDGGDGPLLEAPDQGGPRPRPDPDPGQGGGAAP